MKRCRIEMVDLLHPATDFLSKDEEHPIVCEYRPVPKSASLNHAKLDFVGAKEADSGSPKSRAEKAARSNRVVESRTKTLTYRGSRVESREAIDKYVVFRNRKTDKVCIVETELMYTMRPRITHDAIEESSIDSSDDEDAPDVLLAGGPADLRSIAEQREELLRLFGGRKSQTAFDNARREQGQQIRAGLAAEHATKAIELAAANMAQTATGNDGTSRHLAPPHNPAATDPALCYPLEGLMSPAELDAICDEARRVREAIDASSNFSRPEGWSELAFVYFLKVVANEDIGEELRTLRCGACVYMNYLLTFMEKPARFNPATRLQLEAQLKLSESAGRRIFERFYDKAGPNLMRSEGKTDKIIYYIAVLWFTVQGFEKCNGIGEMGGALNITSKEMAKYIKRVGGSFLKSQEVGPSDYGDFMASLKTPLTFPPIVPKRKGKKARRRK